MPTLVENGSGIESQVNEYLIARERKAFGKMMAKFVAIVLETQGKGNYQEFIGPMTKSMGLHRINELEIEKGGVKNEC